jgi:hypothetical protein
MKRFSAIVFVVLVACLRLTATAHAAPEENDVYVLTAPERSIEQIEAAYAQMPPMKYTPPADRWNNLPRTAAILS